METPPRCKPEKHPEFLRPMATGFMARSSVSLSNSKNPFSSYGRVCPSSYKMGHQSGLSYGGSGLFV